MYNPPVITNIVELYIEEVLFLYNQREMAAYSYSEYLPDLLELDERLLAQLDGVKISAEASWEYCAENFDFEATEEIFAVTSAVLAINDNKKIDKIVGVCGENVELLDAMVDACIWYEFVEIEQTLNRLINSEVIENQYIAIRAYAGHEKYSDQLAGHLVQALNSDSLLLNQAALYAIAKLGLTDLKDQLSVMMQHDNEDVRFAALYSATRFGNADALEKIKAFVVHPDYGDIALQFVSMQKDVNNTLDILKELYQEDSTKRRSIEGLGYIGNATSIPQLIMLMKTPGLARIAGSALSTITGINLEQLGLTTEAPEGFNAGPTEDPEDENVEMDPDEDLPWPDAEKLYAWWSAAETQQQYSSTNRYLFGKPLSKAQLQLVLRSGNQKQRLFCAHYLSVNEHRKPVFNCCAPAKRQKKLMAI